MAETHFTPIFKDAIVVLAAVKEASIDSDVTSETFGHLIVEFQSGDKVDYGIVTAYAAAVNAGYTGTEEQWRTELATVRAYATGKKYKAGVLSDLEDGDTGYHDNAKYYSDAAAASARSAAIDSFKAEGFALGTQDGTEDQRYATNNASYFATQSRNSATDSSTDALKSEGYANGTQNGTAVNSGTYFENNSKYWANEAAGYAKGVDLSNNALHGTTNSKYYSELASDSQHLAERYAKGTEDGADAVNGTAGYQDNAKYYRDLANAAALKAEGFAVGTQDDVAVQSGTYYENNAEHYKDLAQAAYTSLTNLTVGVTTGEADTNATVVKSVVNNHDHLQFTIPRGTPFIVYRTYASIAAMVADKANVPEGKFVMIAATVEEPDNSKLYIRTSSSEDAEAFSFITDLSGATGVQGPVASATTSVSYKNSTNASTPPSGTWSATPDPIAGEYTWSKTELTWNDTNNTVSTIYNVAYNGTGIMIARSTSVTTYGTNAGIIFNINSNYNFVPSADGYSLIQTSTTLSTTNTHSSALPYKIKIGDTYINLSIDGSSSLDPGDTISVGKGLYLLRFTAANGFELNTDGLLPGPTATTTNRGLMSPEDKTKLDALDNSASIGSKADKEDTVLLSYLSRGRKENTTIGARSFAFGDNVIASGSDSFAIGYSTTASADKSIAMGGLTQATAYQAFSEGTYTVASGYNSHAEGYYTQANLNNMHAAGSYNVAGTRFDTWVANTSYSVGDRVRYDNNGYECKIANSDASFTAANWDLLPSDGNLLYAIGNSADSNNRSNAAELDIDGNVEFAGDVIAKGCGGANPISLSAINDAVNSTTVETSLLAILGTSIGSPAGANFSSTCTRENNTVTLSGCLYIGDSSGYISATSSTYKDFFIVPARYRPTHDVTVVGTYMLDHSGTLTSVPAIVTIESGGNVKFKCIDNDGNSISIAAACFSATYHTLHA